MTKLLDSPTDSIGFSDLKKQVIDSMDQVAENRDQWIKKSSYYYKDLVSFLKFNIDEDLDILEVGTGTGFILNSLAPRFGVGIDISGNMIRRAKQSYPHLAFMQMDAENIDLDATFDYIVLSDTVGYLEDVQEAFLELRKVSRPETRLIITFQNFLWTPLLTLAERLKLKMPSRKLNWLNIDDLENLLSLADFEIIRTGRRFLLPKNIPLIAPLFNRYIAHLPLINRLCLTSYIVAKPRTNILPENRDQSVSVIIPARNEKGHIEQAIQRMPKMGGHTEIIFVEGGSTDGTLDEIKRVCEVYSREWDIKYVQQSGRGKGDAVRKGFALAQGDILMILDADLTVPPEDLNKFYDAIADGHGEYINGSRLVYPLETEAMRTLNLIANKTFSWMFSWLIGQKLKDTLCGTKVISKKNWERVTRNRKYFGDFDPFGDFDLIFGAAKLNLIFKEVPVRYKARQYGTTNISRFRHGWLLIRMVFFAMKKIKFF